MVPWQAAGMEPAGALPWQFPLRPTLRAPLLNVKLPQGLVPWGLSGQGQCLWEVGQRRSHHSLGSWED